MLIFAFTFAGKTFICIQDTKINILILHLLRIHPLNVSEASLTSQGLKGAVERHLDRFAFRELPLTYDWQDAPAS